MDTGALSREAAAALDEIGSADIVVGIPSFNNESTIGHVVSAIQAGLDKYFHECRGVIINSDGGSTDGTRDAVLKTVLDKHRLLMVSTPRHPVHRLSFPYHGVPGKGSAFRLIFQMASRLGARACAVVDSDLRSITPEWPDLLLRPVFDADYDFVAPYYHRHKYDGTITNSIVYPLTRMLYGYRVRQPIGGDFGLSPRLLARYLERGDWETDTARFGIDIWMTTIALAEGFRVCQSFLGAKLHDAKDPGLDLSAMLHQVVGSVFRLMQDYEPAWKSRTGSEDVDLFGFLYGVGLDPIAVNTDRMLATFHRGCAELGELWSMALPPDVCEAVQAVSCKSVNGGRPMLDNDLWTRIILHFAVAYKNLPVERAHLLRSLTPLYLARVASFVLETKDMGSDAVEAEIERLCLCFENRKAELIQHWDSGRGADPEDPAGASGRSPG